jgi:hypothetical protein
MTDHKSVFFVAKLSLISIRKKLECAQLVVLLVKVKNAIFVEMSCIVTMILHTTKIAFKSNMRKCNAKNEAQYILYLLYLIIGINTEKIK